MAEAKAAPEAEGGGLTHSQRGQRTTAGLRQPLLMHSAGSPEKATFAAHKRTFSRAAGVSPPWLSEPHMQVQCDGFRRFEFVCGVHATLVADATTIRRENDDSCDEQTHVHKSGGRQPAVVFGTRLRWNCDFYREMNTTKSGGREPAVVRRIASASAVRRISAFGSRVLSASHGGLTPPPLLSLVQRASAGRKTVFCGAQTHVHKSGGRQPAVGIANASAVVLVCHGRLTPTALVLRCERLSAKKRFLRCANACLQERRASARRGNVTHLRRRLFPTAGLRQPLLFDGAGRLKNDDIRAAQTHVYKSGERQPAVDSVTQLRQRSLTDDWLLAPMRQS
jgi:hypothetical protein